MVDNFNMILKILIMLKKTEDIQCTYFLICCFQGRKKLNAIQEVLAYPLHLKKPQLENLKSLFH